MRDRTVLVIESDPGVRALLIDLLEDAGYAVLHAERGHQGLSVAERDAPSVVVVNHDLPDMSGLDLLDDLQRSEATRHVPVILVSGRIQQLDSSACRSDRVLSMPFDIAVLLEHVEQLAQASRIPVA
jgi:CheY-like chemotaxis protein